MMAGVELKGSLPVQWLALLRCGSGDVGFLVDARLYVRAKLEMEKWSALC